MVKVFGDAAKEVSAPRERNVSILTSVGILKEERADLVLYAVS